MKRIFLTGILLGLSFIAQGCAQDDSSSEPVAQAPVVSNSQSQAEPPTLTPPVEKLCHEDLICQDRCNITFKFTTNEAIAREASARGTNPFKTIMNNNLAVMNHDACMNTPVSKIVDFLYHPFTLEDLGRVQYGTGCYYYENSIWHNCPK